MNINKLTSRTDVAELRHERAILTHTLWLFFSLLLMLIKFIIFVSDIGEDVHGDGAAERGLHAK